MVTATLTIRCWNCGGEQVIVEHLDDDVVDFNLDKPCPACTGAWMTKKALLITKG